MKYIKWPHSSKYIYTYFWWLIPYINLTRLRDTQITGRTLLLGICIRTFLNRGAFELVDWVKKTHFNQCEQASNQSTEGSDRTKIPLEGGQILFLSSSAGTSCPQVSELLVVWPSLWDSQLGAPTVLKPSVLDELQHWPSELSSLQVVYNEASHSSESCEPIPYSFLIYVYICPIIYVYIHRKEYRIYTYVVFLEKPNTIYFWVN